MLLWEPQIVEKRKENPFYSKGVVITLKNRCNFSTIISYKIFKILQLSTLKFWKPYIEKKL